jgi:tetratricopeptide (TPR) repeat protein
MVDDTADDAFASVAASLVQAGVRSVVAMSHAVMVSGAQEFIPPFYGHLFETGSLAEAARAGRNKMLARPERLCARGRFPLQDWLVPVVYEQAEGPFDFVADAAPPTDGAPDLPDPPEEVKNPFGFIGRDSELLQLERAVRHDPPGILFHGLGGIGKTTLVWGFLRWLADTGGLSRKPFWFTFSKIHSAEHVLNRIGERLDGPEFPTRDTKEKLDVLVKRLDERPHVLVWDNFESAAAIDEEAGQALLSEDDRETLRRLLHRLHGTGSKLLVTSRNREDWLGEDEYVQRHTLGGLRGEERWQFCERIAANLPDVSLNRDDDDLKKLMDTLRGHPLAMRVVLSRLANQSPKDLQKTVQNNLDELKSAEDDGIGRLYATLGLLYEALDDDLRELLIPLHLHEGYVDASQIEEMANEAESPLTREQIDRGLRDLANVGLLQNVRDHVLYAAHPALTGYLRAQRNDLKSTAPVDEWTRAFVQVLAAKADSLLPPTPLHELRGFLSYHERNVLHADRLADQESWIDERRTFEKFLASAAERRGLYTAAVRRYEAWLEMSKQLDDKVGIAKVQAQLSSIAMKKRNYEKAEKGFLKAGKKFASLNDARSVAVTYHHLGRVAQERRKPEEAEKWYRKSVEMKKRINDERGMATTYQQIGFVALQQGNHQKAEKWCKKSIEIKERIGNKSGAAKTYHVLGVIAQDKRDYKKADKWYRKSAEIKERLGDYHGAATTYHQLGQVAEECREFEKAEKWHHKSAAIGERLDDELGAAKSYHHLGLVAQERGRLEEAEKWYRKSAEIEERLDEEYFAAKTFYQLGRVAQEQREFEEAEKWYCKAVEMEETIGEETFVAKMYHQLGLVVHEQGAYEEAEKWYRKSLEIEERVGDEHGAAETYRELGNLALDQEDWLEAGRRILRAIRGFKISTDIRNAQRTMSDFGKIYDAAPQDIQDALRKRWIDAGHPEEKLDELRAQLE